MKARTVAFASFAMTLAVGAIGVAWALAPRKIAAPDGATELNDTQIDGVRTLEFSVRDPHVADEWLRESGFERADEQMDMTIAEASSPGVFDEASHGCKRVALVYDDVGAVSLLEVCDDAAMQALREARAAALAEGVRRANDDGDDLGSDDEGDLVAASPLRTPEHIGTFECEVLTGSSREVYELDERHRLLRHRTWLQSRRESVERWSYDADGWVKEEVSRSSTQPDGVWQERAVTPPPAADGEWSTIALDYGEAEVEPYRYRVVDGRLVESVYEHLAGADDDDHVRCRFDAEGRPAEIEMPATRERYTYVDGRLASITASAPDEEGYTDEVQRNGSSIVLGERTYTGDCTEIVFEACSAARIGVGTPLPDGLL